MASPHDHSAARSRPHPWRVVPVLAWAALIFGVSSVPGSGLPGGYSVEGHLFEYAVLGVLALAALAERGSVRLVALLALCACAVYAVTDEFHQSFVPGRMPDPLDWATDVLGAASGIAGALLVGRRRRARHGSPQ